LKSPEGRRVERARPLATKWRPRERPGGSQETERQAAPAKPSTRRRTALPSGAPPWARPEVEVEPENEVEPEIEVESAEPEVEVEPEVEPEPGHPPLPSPRWFSCRFSHLCPDLGYVLPPADCKAISALFPMFVLTVAGLRDGVRRLRAAG
jgi:hypothetical protein